MEVVPHSHCIGVASAIQLNSGGVSRSTSRKSMYRNGLVKNRQKRKYAPAHIFAMHFF